MTKLYVNMLQLFREELSHYISQFAEVPLGNVIVIDVKAVNGSDCLIVSLWITGMNGTLLQILG